MVKKYIAADTKIDYDSMSEKEFLKWLCSRLQEAGINTQVHRYELCAEEYDRFSSGKKYVVDFKCPGDYLAYFAMVGHKDVQTLANLSSCVKELMWNYDIDTFDAFLEIFGRTVAGMEDFASDNWWGDGDDYIIYLKNLDTGKTLYRNDDSEPEIYDEDDEDWDDWED